MTSARTRKPARTTLADTFYPIVWQLVSAIPLGKIASYGQIASMAGYPGYSRWVGRALGAAADRSKIPWWRVMNSQGRIAMDPGSPCAIEQQQRLAAEGVLAEGGRYSRKRYLWQP